MVCSRCAVRLLEFANYCHNCGLSISEIGVSARPNSLPAKGTDFTNDFDSDTTALDTAVQFGVGGSLRVEMDESERDIWEGRFSPKALAGSTALLILITLASLTGVAVAAVRGVPWLWMALLISIPVLWALQLFRLAKRWLSSHYRLTDRRLIRQLGLFQRHKDQLNLARVESVRILQNVLHRVLDVGSIEITSSDRRLRYIIMEGIDNADELAEKIRSLARSGLRKPVEAAEGVAS